MVQISSRARQPDFSAKVLDKKREILDAASRVFRDRGLHATGMRDIAAELGMAVGNLYYYFKDKEELLAFVQEDALAGLLELAARAREKDLRADTRLFLLIEGHVVRLNEETPGSLAHLEVEALGEPWRREIQAQRDEYERTFRDLLEEGSAAGVFRAVDSKVGALTILGAVNWTVKWFRPDGGKSAGEIGRECAELLVRGLLKPGVEMERPEESAPSGLALTPPTPSLPASHPPTGREGALKDNLQTVSLLSRKGGSEVGEEGRGGEGPGGTDDAETIDGGGIGARCIDTTGEMLQRTGGKSHP
jgi:AcrR family transcriptional regulator